MYTYSTTAGGVVYATALSSFPASGAFWNYGEFRTYMPGFSSSLATMQFNCPFNNLGVLNVTAGITVMATGGSHTGQFFHVADSFITFNGGTHTLQAASVINDGSGIRMSAGTINVYGSFYPQNFLANGAATINFYVPFSTNSSSFVIAGTTRLNFGASSVNKLSSLSLQGGGKLGFLNSLSILR